MKIGYARVSTEAQNLSLQLEELKSFGCDKIFSEKVSSRKNMPEKDKALSILSEGDTLIVWKLDRLARSTIELLGDIQKLTSKGVHFISLRDSIDTSTSGGRFQLAVFSALAELERDMIRERTLAGLAVARQKGRIGGRPKGMSEATKKRCEVVNVLVNHGNLSVKAACEMHHLSKATYYQYLRELGMLTQKREE